MLAGHREEIGNAWQRRLTELGIQTRQLVPDGLDFAGFADRLRGASYPQFRERLQGFGGVLAGKGHALDRTVAAFDRLFEICLPYLAAEGGKRAGPVLALSRLYALVGLLVVSGYTGQWAGGKRTLVEASLAENEERSRQVSTYITRIYEEERRRLAQDLHDEVGHDLIVIKLYLEMITLDAQSSRAMQPRLAEAIKLISHAIEAVRRLGQDLGPAVFDDLGFLPALRSYVSQFSSRTMIPVKLVEGYVPEIPSSHQVALYRLVQGALSNVLKHAAARHVTITIESFKDSVLVMKIEDDGVGFDTEGEDALRSFGLSAMRERVEMLGGELQIESHRAGSNSAAHGTRVEVDIPLPGGGAR